MTGVFGLKLEENTKYKLFFLSGNESTLRGAINYLKKREWDVQQATDLKRALLSIFQGPPVFLFLSSDHPHKKVRVLPKVLAQAIPMYIIGFSESQSMSAISRLNSWGLDYTLIPPIGGPMIERIINRILKDHNEKKREIHQRYKNGNLTKDEEKFIAIKGDKSATNVSSSQDMQSTLQQMLSGDDSEDSNHAIIQTGSGMGASQMGGMGSSSAQGAQQAGSVAYNPTDQSSSGALGSGGAVGGAAYGNSASNTQDGFGGFAGGSTSSSAHGSEHGNPGTANGLGGFGSNTNSLGDSSGGFANAAMSGINPATGKPYGAAPKRDHNSRDWQDLKKETERRAESYSRSKLGLAPNAVADVDEDDIASAVKSLSKSDIPKSLQPSSQKEFGELKEDLKKDLEEDLKKKRALKEAYAGASIAPIVDEDQKDIHININRNLGGNIQETLMEKGTQKALDESVVRIPPIQNRINKNSNIACITVESVRFSGYLVVALAQDKVIDESFVEIIQKKLFSFLRENGEQVSEKEVMNLKLQEVAFQDWALQKAEFLKKSVHAGNEIAMAFFPAEIKETQFLQSKNDKMLQISMADLREETAVEFDLYVYLPENDKYILYTPEKSTLYGNQKKRLQDKGVTHLHLKKESQGAVKKYKAQNYLNDKISEYHEKKASL